MKTKKGTRLTGLGKTIGNEGPWGVNEKKRKKRVNQEERGPK